MKFTTEEIELIKQFMIDYKFNLKLSLKKRHLDIYNKVMEETQFLSEKASMQERLYCIIHDIHSPVLCSYCHKNVVKFRSPGEYARYCSISCGVKDTAQQAMQVKLEKYGSKVNIEKAKQTRIEKYGSYHSADFGQKVKQTKLERYGDPNYTNKEKSTRTNFERYGVEIPLQSKSIRDKMKQTNLEKYGDPYYNNPNAISETKQKFSKEKNETINNKRKQTNLERYGVEAPNQNEKIMEKTKNTCLQKYGTSSTLTIFSVREAGRKYLKEKSYEIMLSRADEYEPMFSKEEFIKRNTLDRLQWKHKKCGEIVYGRYIGGKILAHCRKCYPYGSSIQEKEIEEFLREFYKGTIETNNRFIISPKELDIYLPLKSLAIEFDGLFWHATYKEDDERGKIRHIEKTQLCENLNIHLIHIFENEWLSKKDIVKSRLRNLLGSYDQKIYARKCQVKEIDSETSMKFQEKNHIQGAVRSKVNLGLYYTGELISLMSFSKPRLNKKYEWELVRFCNKLNYHIPGASSKLLTYFERTYKPKSIISYADRRWTMNNGNTVYDKLGFKLDHIGRPVYWYVYKDHTALESRLKYQKHKLPQLLEHFDPSKTEVQNMLENGHEQVFDCGNLVYVKTY